MWPVRHSLPSPERAIMVARCTECNISSRHFRGSTTVPYAGTTSEVLQLVRRLDRRSVGTAWRSARLREGRRREAATKAKEFGGIWTCHEALSLQGRCALRQGTHRGLVSINGFKRCLPVLGRKTTPLLRARYSPGNPRTHSGAGWVTPGPTMWLSTGNQ